MEIENINVQNSFVALYEKYVEQNGEKHTTGEYEIGIFKKIEKLGNNIMSQSIHPINMSSIGTPKLENIQLYEDIKGEVVLGELNWENSSSKSYNAIENSIARFANNFDGKTKSIVFEKLAQINGEYDSTIGMKPLSSITSKESITFEEAKELLQSYAKSLGLKEEVLAQLQKPSTGRSL